VFYRGGRCNWQTGSRSHLSTLLAFIVGVVVEDAASEACTTPRFCFSFALDLTPATCQCNKKHLGKWLWVTELKASEVDLEWWIP